MRKLLLLPLLPLLVSCAAEFDIKNGDGSNNILTNGVPVCDPLGGDPGAPTNGLKGKLYALESAQPRYTQVNDYINFGTLITSQLYLSRLFVPTTAFNLGFKREDGTVLVDSSNAPLIEYFAINMESNIVLTAADAVGDYQFGLLADDGSILELKNSSGNYQNFLNNDGQHPTKFACANQVVGMNRSSKVPMRLKYYQGPRNHIALALMWRKIKDGDTLNDFACGLSGNDLFWDSTKTPSVAQPTYIKMTTQSGWKPLETGNFLLPDGQTNPCVK